MKTFLRSTLKNILGLISKLTIKKHNTEVIVITGWAGTSIVRELSYQILSEKFNVRRNTSEVWWDLSVPLCILGYEDKRRSVFEWLLLILKASLSLITKRKHSHKIIINLDTSIEDVADFWTKYITPHMLVILRERPKSRVIAMFKKKSKEKKILFIYNPKLYPSLAKSDVHRFLYSQNGKDLIFNKIEEYLVLKYKDAISKIRIPQFFRFIYEFIPAAVSIGLVEGMKLEDIAECLTHFSLHPAQMQEGLSHLKKFIDSNG